MKRPDLVLAGAVVLSLPMVRPFMSGTLSPVRALEGFLLALIVAWIAGAVISSVVTRYSNEARQAEIVRQLEEARRATEDPVPPDRVSPPK